MHRISKLHHTSFANTVTSFTYDVESRVRGRSKHRKNAPCSLPDWLVQSRPQNPCKSVHTLLIEPCINTGTGWLNWRISSSLSVGRPIQDEAMYIALSAPQGFDDLLP